MDYDESPDILIPNSIPAPTALPLTIPWVLNSRILTSNLALFRGFEFRCENKIDSKIAWARNTFDQPLFLIPKGDISKHVLSGNWGVSSIRGHVPASRIYVRFTADCQFSMGTFSSDGNKPYSAEAGTDFYKLPNEGIMMLLISITEQTVR